MTDKDPNKRIPTAKVLEICGGVSSMSLHRWLNNKALGFPRPIYIGNRRYWREADVIAWLDTRPQKAA